MTREDTRNRLFRAAVELIAEQGFAGTTVDAIAERAGVAKGTVFYNFGSKDGLFAALLDHGIQRLTASLAEAAEVPAEAPAVVRGNASRPPGTAAAPLARLDAVVLAQLRFFDEYGPFARVLFGEMWRTAWHDAVVRLRQGALGVYERVLADVRADTVAAGELRADFDTGTAATALFGMVLTVSIERRVLRPDHPLEEVHATLVELIHGRVTSQVTNQVTKSVEAG
ncbi:TetR/AcrR family transcriptional regulator [Microtetraspora sp. NBRC 16547]|uniref:TetR/AcrR family transcriptional regulator n=1 Tax=Microtetraspora sp. NBRC 16547 TaxID=3030993 RepID=UPI0024A07A12|nr:TetR/AcrR family transcriptional regulator [Microtetraspora sp. NBRC 16547]GLW95929.1 TetR family transcriptional regulator [Microtetraspora sp. NBRC 16547]